jgi:NAD(P)-dependent dehydrogenase (short-subunit alcohol dehydrogenase family)
VPSPPWSRRAGERRRGLDIQILQTAGSLETLAVATYAAALELDFVMNRNKVIARTAMKQHADHLAAFNAQARKLGGKEQTQPNAKYAKIVEAAKLTLKARATVVQVDISDEHQVTTLFEQAVGAFGGVDILVNNAGVDASGKDVSELPTDVWDRAIRTNLYRTFFCCRRFIQLRLQAGGGGKIISVTSVHEDIPHAGGADCDCSKGGVRNLTRTLALEFAPSKINVNNLAPGMVLTPFNQPAIHDPELLEEQVQSIPWKGPPSRRRSPGWRCSSLRATPTTSPGPPTRCTVA